MEPQSDLVRTTHYSVIKTTIDPTHATYEALREAWDHFNERLFDSALPDCLVTLQRKRGAKGYYCFSRFGERSGEEVVDEISLNPATFLERTDREIISTLVHEMAHQWQFHFGKPGRRGYHNKEWARKMLELGLIPTHTGLPGGKQTGQSMTHYIEENGPYDTHWRELESAGFTLDYQDRHPTDPASAEENKGTLCLSACAIHVWGKPLLRIACVACTELMT